MIEINLLPQELKTKIRQSEAGPPVFLFFIPAIFAILILTHLSLAMITITKSVQLTSLNGSWRKLGPQRKDLENFHQEYSLLSEDTRVLQQLIGKKINWSQKLNRLSLDLPSGVWFSEITLTRGDFILKGSVVSLEKDELGVINKFLENLKSDADFIKNFQSLGLGPLRRRVVGGYEIIDFVLSGNVKAQ